ncbi:MAG: recombinase family protein [Kiritimatiellia bacterium]|nr:recombinase family protein [Kiritimatiellia bacterium]
MKVVIWARVSSREQSQGYSIDAQLRTCRERAQKNDWTVLREFVVAESAKRGAERVAFNEMFKWVRANARKEGIKAILAHKLDRVCRNMRDAVRLQELEDACGVHLAFLDNQFGPGAAGALSFNVMAAVAQYYSDNLRSEVLKGFDEKVKQGWPTGLAPYGYLNVPDRSEPVQPHPIESKAVIRLFELFASGQYTIESVATKLFEEGFVYRRSQPRFNRSSTSHVLNNRFYAGEIIRNGQVYPGRYKLFIQRTTFDACQDILRGKNRRTGCPQIALSGGLLRCGVCGCAITGEHIRRKLRNGDRNIHVYYRCANNHKSEDHPPLRWREADVEQLIVAELDGIRIPNPNVQEWLRKTIECKFSDLTSAETDRRGRLAKRRTELVGMQDRLLNAFLQGVVDEAAFNVKSSELKAEIKEVERQLDGAGAITEENGRMALSVFDFSQNLVEIWRGSDSARRRTILECVSLNRVLTDATLCVTKRSPFDWLAERPFSQIGSGGRI